MPRESTGYKLVYEAPFFVMAFIANLSNSGTNWIRRAPPQLPMFAPRAMDDRQQPALRTGFVLDRAFNVISPPGVSAH